MTMVPTYTFIDRATGYFNKSMEFKKDYAAILSAMWELDSVIDDFLMNPEDDSYIKLKELGIDDLSYNSEDELHKINIYRNKILNKVNSLPEKARKRFLGEGDIIS